MNISRGGCGIGRFSVVLFCCFAGIMISSPARAFKKQIVMIPMRDGVRLATDIYVPDGRSMLIIDGLVRASHREGYDKRVPITPGQVYKLVVDLWSTSIIINKGHGIRVSVSGSNFPRFDINQHNGRYFDFQPGELEQAFAAGIMGYAKKPDLAADAKAGNYVLHLSGKYPSHILLPIINSNDH